MKIFLLLCLSFVPWSHGRGYPSNGPAQKPTTQPQPQTSTQTSEPPKLNCNHMEHLRAAHLREHKHTPKGDKFDDFDWKLGKELNAVERGNIVISPISLKVVLAMLYEGAGGKTAGEIGEALDIHDGSMQRRKSRERFSTILESLQTSDNDDYKIKMGTHAFIDQTAEVYTSYQCKLKTYYNSDIVKVDFSNPSAAVKVINNWAKNVTEGHIHDLISESEAQSSTIMLLLNAVYFKGQWEVPFPANQTKPGTFHLDDKNTVTVPLMNVTERFGYFDLPQYGAHMLQLPYKGNKFSMYVLLPYNATGLDAIVKTLGPERSLSGVIGHMMQTTVNLVMPKFEFDFTTKLRSTLEKLNIKTMFSSEAELGDIAKTKGKGLVVSNVLQKAGISVTEVGTEAYAATAIDLVDKFGGSEETVDFIVDRPFLFFIEDTSTRTTVFVGKVTNPDNAKVVSTPTEAPEQSTGDAEGEGESESDALSDRVGQGQNGQTGNKGPTNQSEPKEHTSQSRFNFFDGDLLQAVSRDVRGNFVISPASVKTLLGLMLEAADGSTFTEIKSLLRLPKNSMQARQLMGSLKAVLQKMNTSQIEVDSETHAFISKEVTFNTSYAKAISDTYRAGVTTEDFKSPDIAANRINSWINSRTGGKITDLLEPSMLDPQTLTVLVNAVYFNARWQEEFLLKDTREECFYSEPSLTCTKVPIMYKKDMLAYKFERDYNSHIVQLPYKDERFSMVLVVPTALDGSRRILQDLNRLTFPSLLDRATKKEVHLKLPRFTAEYESDLKMTLTKMGLNTAFTSEARLPYMINNKQGRVSAFIHKAKIEVTEKGTKAAAASGAAVVPLMSGDEAELVVADRPFYYFIYETESRSVLFSGRVSSLTGESGNEENAVGEEAVVPLGGGEKPSYSQVAQNGPASYGQAGQNGQASYNGAQNKPASYNGAQNGPASYNGAQNGQASYNGAQNGPASYNGAQNGPASYNGAQNGQASYNGAQNGPVSSPRPQPPSFPNKQSGINPPSSPPPNTPSNHNIQFIESTNEGYNIHTQDRKPPPSQSSNFEFVDRPETATNKYLTELRDRIRNTNMYRALRRSSSH